MLTLDFLTKPIRLDTRDVYRTWKRKMERVQEVRRREKLTIEMDMAAHKAAASTGGCKRSIDAELFVGYLCTFDFVVCT